MSQSVGNLYVQLSVNNAGLVQGLNQAGTLIQQFNKQTINFNQGGTGGGIGLFDAAKLGAGVGILYQGVTAAKHFAEEGYRSQVEYSKTATALEAMTGSAAEAQKLLGQSRDFAMNSPFDPGQVSQFTRQLLGAGVATEQVVPTIKALSDVSAGIGGDFGLVARAYTQVMAKGRLYAEELNGQFADQGLGAKAFADALRLPQEEFLKMVKAGEVSSSMVTQAFANMTAEGGKFFDLSKKLADADPIAQLNKQLAETGRLLTDATLKAVGFQGGMNGLNGHLGQVNRALGSGEFQIKAGQIRNDAVQVIGEAAMGWESLFTWSARGRAELKQQLDLFRGGIQAENAAAERELYAIFDKQKGNGIGPLIPPPPVYVLPPLVKEYIDKVEKFKPVEFIKFDGEKYQSGGFGPYSQFRDQLAFARQAIEPKLFGGGGLNPDIAGVFNARAFLDLEKQFTPPPGSNRAPLLEVGSQADYDFRSRFEERMENRNLHADDRVKEGIERAKAFEQEQLKLLREIADALKRRGELQPVTLSK